MKRSTAIATFAVAAAVVGGGALTGVALGSSAGDGQSTATTASFISGTPDTDDQTAGTKTEDRAGGEVEREGRDDAGAGPVGGSDTESGQALPRAVETALGAVPGTVTEIELESDDGRWAWEIEILGDDGKWHELDIDRSGEQVLTSRVKGERGAERARELLADTEIDAVTAARVAQDYTFATVVEVELEDDRQTWEIELRGEDGTEHELEVHRISGEISDYEQDDDDD